MLIHAAIVLAALAAAGTVFVIALDAVLHSADAEEKRWAMGYLTGTIGVLVGYLVRR